MLFKISLFAVLILFAQNSRAWAEVISEEAQDPTAQACSDQVAGPLARRCMIQKGQESGDDLGCISETAVSFCNVCCNDDSQCTESCVLDVKMPGALEAASH